MYKTVYTEVEVDVDLSDFSDDDLIEEIESRGLQLPTDLPTDLVTAIYFKRRSGQDYQRELDELIYSTIGKIV